MKLNEIELSVLRRLLNRGGDILGDHKAEASLLEKIFKKPKLSILICHLTDRKALLDRLMAVLQPQVDAADGDVEVLIETDSGEMTTGKKRNILLDKANAGWICYIDDDDICAQDYCSKILSALESNPDCVSMKGVLYRSGEQPRNFYHSIKHGKEWFEKDSEYFRPANHLNAVRRELALQVKFPEITVGEDHSYSSRLFPLLKTESETEGVLYEYHA